MKLIDKVKDDVDPFVIDSEVALEILNQPGTSNVSIRKANSDRCLFGNEPLLFEPEFKRLYLKARRGQKFLLA
jgi:hypothetical protein